MTGLEDRMEDDGLTECKTLVLNMFKEQLKGSTVIDLGCWNGKFGKVCLDLGAKKVIGIDDLSYTKAHSDDPYFGRDSVLQMVDSRIEFRNENAEYAKLETVDFTLGYDVIFCFDDPLAFLNKLRTKYLLCTFIITDHPEVGTEIENVGYSAVKHRYTTEQAKQLLKKAGFLPYLVYGIYDRAFFFAVKGV